VHFRKPKTTAATAASTRDARFSINHNTLAADGTTAYKRQEGEQRGGWVTPGGGKQPLRANGVTVQLRQAINRFSQVLRRHMRKLVPLWIEGSITQAKIRGDINDFTALLEQRRHQVHGL